LGGYDKKSFAGIPDEQVMPEETYQESQKRIIESVFTCLKPSGVVLYNHMDRLKNNVTISPLEWLLPLKAKDIVVRQTIVWDKRSTHNHTTAHLYPQIEYIYILHRKGAKIYFQNQDFFWKDAKNKGSSNVWSIPRESAKGKFHTAPMPLNLARHLIRLYSKPGDLVCDPYSGSGTTMLAAIKEGRRFVGTEKSPEFFQNSIHRVTQGIELSR
jgi:site-specific DNA-methyltransferase (adenine-specific)